VGDIDGHIVDHCQGEWDPLRKKKKKNQLDAMAALKAAEPAQVSRHSMLL
jgi:hypothetical protein